MAQANFEPEKLRQFLRRVRLSTHAVLQYDSNINDLTVWKWCVYSMIYMFRNRLHFSLPRPVNGAGERVTPSELSDYRITHDFLGPCCLCAIPTENLAEGAVNHKFMEALMQLSTPPSRFQGEFIARCAQNRCGFLGEPSSLPIISS